MFSEKIAALEKALSLDYIDFDIQIGKKLYKFHPPVDKKDANRLSKDRRNLITFLLREASHVLVQEALLNYYDDEEPVQSIAFERIDFILNSIPSREQIASPIDPDSYQEIREQAKKQVGLNYDAYQVKMQDPNLEISYDS